MDYDAAGLAVVKIGDSFGVVDYMGKMAVEEIEIKEGVLLK